MESKYVYCVLFIVLSVGLYAFASPLGMAKEGNIKHIEVKIEGMTCEIGCARIIESKVSKLKGVRYASVNFNDSLGQFSFDSDVLDESTIIKTITDIGNGKLYKVLGVKQVKEFKTK